MRKLTLVFYYYTLCVVTLLCLTSFIFLEAPYNLFQTLVLVPSLIYLWLRVTDPVNATETAWSLRLVIVVGLIVSTGMFGYYLIDQKSTDALSPAITDNQESTIASLSAQIVSLNAELTSMRSKQNNDNQASEAAKVADLINSLDTLPSPTPVSIAQGTVKVRSESPIDIFENESVNSRIIGIAQNSDEFPYFSLSNGFYKIDFGEDQIGYIESNKAIIK